MFVFGFIQGVLVSFQVFLYILYAYLLTRHTPPRRMQTPPRLRPLLRQPARTPATHLLPLPLRQVEGERQVQQVVVAVVAVAVV